MNDEKKTEKTEQHSEIAEAPRTERLTIEVPTEIEAGLGVPTCTCPPGCNPWGGGWA